VQEEESAATRQSAASELMQLQLGSSGFAITVPRSYRNGYGTIDEVQANQIAMSRFSMMMF